MVEKGKEDKVDREKTEENMMSNLRTHMMSNRKKRDEHPGETHDEPPGENMMNSLKKV